MNSKILTKEKGRVFIVRARDWITEEYKTSYKYSTLLLVQWNKSTIIIAVALMIGIICWMAS